MTTARIDIPVKAVARAIRLRLRAEGRAAFAGQEFAPTPPYPPDTQAYHEWLHGWWSVHYGLYCAACFDKHPVQTCPELHAELMKGTTMYAPDPPSDPPPDDAPGKDCDDHGPYPDDECPKC